jgi:hypothetical protein
LVVAVQVDGAMVVAVVAVQVVTAVQLQGKTLAVVLLRNLHWFWLQVHTP